MVLRALQAGFHAFNRGCARFRKIAGRRLAGYVQTFVALACLAVARLLPRRPRSVGPGLNPAEADPRACPQPVRSSAANGPERSEGAQGQLSEGVGPAGRRRSGQRAPHPRGDTRQAKTAVDPHLRGGYASRIRAPKTRRCHEARPPRRRGSGNPGGKAVVTAARAGPWPLIPAAAWSSPNLAFLSATSTSAGNP